MTKIHHLLVIFVINHYTINDFKVINHFKTISHVKFAYFSLFFIASSNMVSISQVSGSIHDNQKTYDSMVCVAINDIG